MASDSGAPDSINPTILPWEEDTRMTDRWNAASMCLFIANIIATGCCCRGRAGLRGGTQPDLPRFTSESAALRVRVGVGGGR